MQKPQGAFRVVALGDIVGKAGRRVVVELLDEFRRRNDVDLSLIHI